MTKPEMKNKFAMLYSIMANSKKVSNMKLFGNVMTDIINIIIEEHPELSEEYINKLCAVKWNNYLTEKEAESICSKMIPSAHWTFEYFKDSIERFGYIIEDKPYYNKYALWTTMNMIYSDSAETIVHLIGTNSEDQILNAIYLLAKDKLCDEDEVFNIRTYFSV